MDLSTLVYFLLASILLTVAPGPDNMYLLAMSLTDAARVGVCLTAGLCTGIFFHTMLVIVGVAALVQSSPMAFGVLRYVGAVYLLYLAWGLGEVMVIWCWLRLGVVGRILGFIVVVCL